jgi:hypothetical protein
MRSLPTPQSGEPERSEERQAHVSLGRDEHVREVTADESEQDRDGPSDAPSIERLDRDHRPDRGSERAAAIDRQQTDGTPCRSDPVCEVDADALGPTGCEGGEDDRDGLDPRASAEPVEDALRSDTPGVGGACTFAGGLGQSCREFRVTDEPSDRVREGVDVVEWHDERVDVGAEDLTQDREVSDDHRPS